MRFDVNTAKSAAMIAFGTLGLSFAPHAQACGELHGQAGAAALAVFESQLEAHSASSLFAAQLTPPGPVSEANTNAAHGQPSLVGMWTVGFYHQGDQLWDVAIEQFYADGNEMTNDNAYPPAQGNVCWRGLRKGNTKSNTSAGSSTPTEPTSVDLISRLRLS